MDYLARLKLAIKARQHTPCAKVTVGGRPLVSFGGTIDYGYDVGSAESTVRLQTAPVWLQFLQNLQIELGYDGLYATAFKGYVEDDNRAFAPLTTEVKGAGYLRKAQYQYDDEVLYTSQTDTAIVENLLSLAGVTDRDVQGAGWTLGVDNDVVLSEGQAPLDVIGQLDQVTGYHTFDSPSDGRVRRRSFSGNPSLSTTWDYEEGVDAFSVSRPRTVRGVHNKVIVTGSDDTVAYAARRADSPFLPAGRDVAYRFSSELIESDTVAMDVATRLMGEMNCIVEEVTIEVAGNPLLHPGDTIGLKAPRVGLTENTHFWLKHITHSWMPFKTRLILERKVGEAGYSLGYPPEPAITYKISGQTFADASTHYTVLCDGSGTYDQDTPIENLTFAWTNDATAQTGTDRAYTLKLVAANFPVTVTLTVSDGTNTAHVHQAIDLTTGDVQLRNLYLAKGTDAEATADCGATWGASTIDAACLSEIAGESLEYFGVGSVLYMTLDFLATAAVACHTFPAAVNAVCVSELNAASVTVGLANGDIWHSEDAANGATSTWVLSYTNVAAVNWVWQDVSGQLWYLVGAQCIVEGRVLADLGATASRLSLSYFGNYFGGSGAVKHVETGVPLTFPGAVTGIKGLCHHIRDDIVWAGDSDAGGSVYATTPGSNDFALVGQTGSPINHLIRDGDFEDVLYAACNGGLFKSDDAGATWALQRAGACQMVGYGSAPWILITPVTIVSEIDGPTKALNIVAGSTPPDGWRDLAFDETGWADAVASGGPWILPDTTTSVTDDNGFVADLRECLIRQKFTLGDGAITTATLTFIADDEVLGMWVNNVWCGTTPPTTGVPGGYVMYSAAVSLPPTVLVAGGDNIITVHFRNHRSDSTGTSPYSVCYKLEVS